ncbi:hypothetical protein L6452_03735 [Arctium lappa]|uniref:Uncharacterized protein n=1 Tax=Arctium lappa TaxID=4217 RepID=A0ACB9FP26_ARCLA|nr:hypothetical protein L6452_03735 [Arctium lappa]
MASFEAEDFNGNSSAMKCGGGKVIQGVQFGHGSSSDLQKIGQNEFQAAVLVPASSSALNNAFGSEIQTVDVGADEPVCTDVDVTCNYSAEEQGFSEEKRQGCTTAPVFTVQELKNTSSTLILIDLNDEEDIAHIHETLTIQTCISDSCIEIHDTFIHEKLIHELKFMNTLQI